MPFVETLIHSLIRWYCTNIPIEIGKGRLQKLGRKFLLRKTIIVPTRHGISVELTFPEDNSWEMLYYRNTFETGTTEIFPKLLRADDVFFDIGANIGWYTLIASHASPDITCHSFEPVEFIFQKLRRNVKVNNLTNTVFYNNTALGDKEDSELKMYTFKGLGHGHSSLSPLDRGDYSISTVSMTTLDSYVADKAVSRVDVIKMDTEGAEMNVLKGATALLRHECPPIWVIELNNETSASFGHKPSDVLDYLASFGEYRFYRVERGWDKVLPMQSTQDYQHGDNAICVPVCRDYIKLS